MISTFGPWILAIAMVATGLFWYERSRPCLRTVALVASIAGLAALGRIAFAPIPGIKPTTDLIFLSGYVLGGAPGFMIGATGAFVANFFFGHGPWTLWQMVAWGGTGIGGAILASLSGKKLGRWTLAGACGIAGIGYGFVLNLSSWLTYSGPASLSGEASLNSFWAYSVAALPFDLAHCVGNIVFCLIFGSALVSSLDRHQIRSRITWLPAG